MAMDDDAHLPRANEQLLNSAVLQLSSNPARMATADHLLNRLAAALVFSFLEQRHRNALDFVAIWLISQSFS
jgi:hypothetical protein